MTVTIPVKTRAFTLQEQQEHVLAYAERPYGTKRAYLAEHHISVRQLHNWTAAMADGNLGDHQIPRKTGTMTTRDVAEIRRLQTENAHLRAARDKAETERDMLAKAADALGKAIDVMREHGVDYDADAPS
ncbi:MAG: hypothetical protein LKI24_17070 [Acidipropionibacterium sp.]|jgi:transposase-like protein|nr:hypothetical protein [Acidipropionibacterium sp.]